MIFLGNCSDFSYLFSRMNNLIWILIWRMRAKRRQATCCSLWLLVLIFLEYQFLHLVKYVPPQRGGLKPVGVHDNSW